MYFLSLTTLTTLSLFTGSYALPLPQELSLAFDYLLCLSLPAQHPPTAAHSPTIQRSALVRYD